MERRQLSPETAYSRHVYNHSNNSSTSSLFGMEQSIPPQRAVNVNSRAKVIFPATANQYKLLPPTPQTNPQRPPDTSRGRPVVTDSRSSSVYSRSASQWYTDEASSSDHNFPELAISTGIYNDNLAATATMSEPQLLLPRTYRPLIRSPSPMGRRGRSPSPIDIYRSPTPPPKDLIIKRRSPPATPPKDTFVNRRTPPATPPKDTPVRRRSPPATPPKDQRPSALLPPPIAHPRLPMDKLNTVSLVKARAALAAPGTEHFLPEELRAMTPARPKQVTRPKSSEHINKLLDEAVDKPQRPGSTFKAHESITIRIPSIMMLDAGTWRVNAPLPPLPIKAAAHQALELLVDQAEADNNSPAQLDLSEPNTYQPKPKATIPAEVELLKPAVYQPQIKRKAAPSAELETLKPAVYQPKSKKTTAAQLETLKPDVFESKTQTLKPDVYQPKADPLKSEAYQPELETLKPDVYQPKLKTLRADVYEPELEMLKPDVYQPKPKVRKADAHQPELETLNPDVYQPKAQTRKADVQEPKLETLKPDVYQPKPKTRKTDENEPKPETFKSDVYESKLEMLHPHVYQPRPKGSDLAGLEASKPNVVESMFRSSSDLDLFGSQVEQSKYEHSAKPERGRTMERMPRKPVAKTVPVQDQATELAAAYAALLSPRFGRHSHPRYEFDDDGEIGLGISIDLSEATNTCSPRPPPQAAYALKPPAKLPSQATSKKESSSTWSSTSLIESLASEEGSAFTGDTTHSISGCTPPPARFFKYGDGDRDDDSRPISVQELPRPPLPPSPTDLSEHGKYLTNMPIQPVQKPTKRESAYYPYIGSRRSGKSKTAKSISKASTRHAIKKQIREHAKKISDVPELLQNAKNKAVRAADYISRPLAPITVPVGPARSDSPHLTPSTPARLSQSVTAVYLGWSEESKADFDASQPTSPKLHYAAGKYMPKPTIKPTYTHVVMPARPLDERASALNESEHRPGHSRQGSILGGLLDRQREKAREKKREEIKKTIRHIPNTSSGISMERPALVQKVASENDKPEPQVNQSPKRGLWGRRISEFGLI